MPIQSTREEEMTAEELKDMEQKLLAAFNENYATSSDDYYAEVKRAAARDRLAPLAQAAVAVHNAAQEARQPKPISETSVGKRLTT